MRTAGPSTPLRFAQDDNLAGEHDYVVGDDDNLAGHAGDRDDVVGDGDNLVGDGDDVVRDDDNLAGDRDDVVSVVGEDDTFIGGFEDGDNVARDGFVGRGIVSAVRLARLQLPLPAGRAGCLVRDFGLAL